MKNTYFVIRLNHVPRELIGPIPIEILFEQLQQGVLSWTDIAFQPGQQWKRLFDIEPLRMLMADFPPPVKLDKYSRICLQHVKESDEQEEESSLPPLSNPDHSVPGIASASTFPPRSLAPTRTAKVPVKQTSRAAAPQTGKPGGKFAPTALPFIRKGGQGVIPRFCPVYLQVEGHEHGPVNAEEARRILMNLKSREQVYIWYRGLRTWFPVQELPDFADLSFGDKNWSRIPPELTSHVFSREGRFANRYGLIALVRWKHPKTGQNRWGVCLDVSATGIQIRVEEGSTWSKGEIREVEVLPLSLLQLPAFTVKCRAVWSNPDQQRLGANFLQMSAECRTQLTAFLTRADSMRAQSEHQLA